MPRKKLPKPTPLASYYFPRGEGIASLIVDEVHVWNNTADAGTRGLWKRSEASTAFDILIENYLNKLSNPLQTKGVDKKALEMLLGYRQTSKLAIEIKPILKKHRIFFGKTALWELAHTLQKSFITAQNAVINDVENVNRLSVNSPEYQFRQKILSFSRKKY
jgi:hypothetical protein